MKIYVYNVYLYILKVILYFTLFINEEFINGFIVENSLSVPEVTLRMYTLSITKGVPS